MESLSYVKKLIVFVCLLLFLVQISFAQQVQSYSYDANGNLISNGVYCYTYNDVNLLSKVENCTSSQLIAEYYYDHAGQRSIKKQYIAGVLQYTIYYVGKHFETKVYPNGTTENISYYYANGERVARKDKNGIVYYHNDHLGSTSVLTDENGTLVEETSYLPYGEVKSGGTETKYLYTGQENDPETGLYYYGARYYDPELMRFAQADPIIQDVYDPQSLNRYSYVRNNPLKYTDPSGNMFADVGATLYEWGSAAATGTVYVTGYVGSSIGIVLAFPFLYAQGPGYYYAANMYHEWKSYNHHMVSIDTDHNRVWLLGQSYQGPTDPKKLPENKQSEKKDWGPKNYELKEGDYKVDSMDEAAKMAQEKSGMPKNMMERDPETPLNKNVFYDESGGEHYRAWVGKKGTPFEGGEYRLDSSGGGNGPDWQHFNYKNPATGEEGHIFFKEANVEAFYKYL